MELVVFSAAEKRDDEIQVIVQMFENGLQGFHLRKPLLPAEEIKKIILQIPAHFHPKIMIHSAHELIDTFQLKGLHYPEKMMSEITKKDFSAKENQTPVMRSRSFHALIDIENNTFPFQYAFLSPIYNSISKPNHHSAFSEEDLKNKIPHLKCKANQTMKLFALGGINKTHLETLHTIGFSGIGVIGSIWNQPDLQTKIKVFKELRIECKTLS